MNFIHVFITLVILCCSLQADERNVNLSWIGFLHLPKKIEKEDKLVKVKTPDMWKRWSKKDYEIDWIEKPKKDYSEEIKVYKMVKESTIKVEVVPSSKRASRNK